MKVLALTTLFPSPHEPTRGTYNYQTFRGLSEFTDVFVVSPRPALARLTRPAELLKPPELEFGGLKVAYPAYWHIPRIAPAAHASSMHASIYPYIRRLKKEFPFDAILAAWAYPDAAVAARLGAEFERPVVARVMGSDINLLAQNPAIRPHLIKGLLGCRTIVAVSDALRARLLDLGIPAERIIVQHNAVDGALFTPGEVEQARSRLGITVSQPIVLYVGNLVQEKGVDVLIEAMPGLLKERPEAHLFMIGKGSLESSLRARAIELGLQERIHFQGPRSHAQIADWMRASNLLCLPSRREGCPNVVLEALASGRPVVASAVGGVPELLRDENGILAPPDNPSALASALAEALERPWDPELLRSTVEYLSWTDVGRVYHATLQSAHSEHIASPGRRSVASV